MVIFSQLIVNHVQFKIVPDLFAELSTEKASDDFTLFSCVGASGRAETAKRLLLNERRGK